MQRRKSKLKATLKIKMKDVYRISISNAYFQALSMWVSWGQSAPPYRGSFGVDDDRGGGDLLEAAQVEIASKVWTRIIIIC